MKFSQKKLSYLVLVLVVGISILFAFKIKNLNFNYDFEAFFPNEDNELETYNKHRDRFEWDNEFVLLGIENKKGIFKKDFLAKISALIKEGGKITECNYDLVKVMGFLIQAEQAGKQGLAK